MRSGRDERTHLQLDFDAKRPRVARAIVLEHSILNAQADNEDIAVLASRPHFVSEGSRFR